MKFSVLNVSGVTQLVFSLFISNCFPLLSLAQRTQFPDIIKSSETSGYRVWVTSMSNSTNALVHDEITYLIIYESQEPKDIWVPKDPEYLFQIDLLDRNGMPLPRTRLGKTVGESFYDLPEKIKKVDLERRKSTSGYSIGAPADFFEITKPGEYTLRLQFQICLKDKAHAWEPRLLRFPPVDYPVIKR